MNMLLLLYLLSLVFLESSAQSVYICYNDTIEIKCPDETFIQIKSAYYKKLSSNICSFPSINQDTNCTLNDTVNIASRCNNLAACDLSVNSTIFPTDSCQGINNYLAVNYTCEFPLEVAVVPLLYSSLPKIPIAESKEKIINICDNNILNISCPNNYAIYIKYSYWGRLSPSICPIQEINQNTNCSLDETEKIATRCTGFQDCQMIVNETWFPLDPCNGSSKYLQIIYTCAIPSIPFPMLFPLESNLNVLNICYNDSYNIECPDNTTISIKLSSYGRTSKNICPYPGINQNVNCKVNETTNIYNKCDGLKNCELTVNSTFFPEDPCVGTNKYLNVRYSCIHLPLNNS